MMGRMMDALTSPMRAQWLSSILAAVVRPRRSGPRQNTSSPATRRVNVTRIERTDSASCAKNRPLALALLGAGLLASGLGAALTSV
jgi:hypothetical protein